jgi:hypothetical protein
MQEALHGLVARHRSRRRDRQHDRDPGQVLSTPEPVRVAASRRAAPERERHPQRQRGRGIGEVVQRVTQQRHRPAGPHDHSLKGGCDPENGKRNLQGPDAVPARLQHRIRLLRRVVLMRSHQRAQDRPRATPLTVLVLVGFESVIVTQGHTQENRNNRPKPKARKPLPNRRRQPSSQRQSSRVRSRTKKLRFDEPACAIALARHGRR